jgi:hypothetical protein
MKNRWHAMVTYRTDVGPIAVEHDLAELDDLHALVERGPHWDTVQEIAIHRVNHTTSANLTVETAQKL